MTHSSQQSLDLAWARINALGSAEPQKGDTFARGYWQAIDDVMAELERLGATRAEWDRENREHAASKIAVFPGGPRIVNAKAHMARSKLKVIPGGAER